MPEVLPPGVEPQPEPPPPRELMSFRKYLEKELAEGKIDFAFRAAETEDGHIYFYVHPQGQDGDTRDFYLNANNQVIEVNQPGPLKTPQSPEPTVAEQIIQERVE